MVTHMKTTIDIADEVLERAKILAREEKTTLKVLTEEGLRLVINSRQRRSPIAIQPVVFHGKGVQPGIPDNFIDNIRDWAYQDEPAS